MSLLVLSRRIGEKILVGDDIEITVAAINGGQVKIGISAPKTMRVDREEVRARINAGLPAPAPAKAGAQ